MDEKKSTKINYDPFSFLTPVPNFNNMSSDSYRKLMRKINKTSFDTTHVPTKEELNDYAKIYPVDATIHYLKNK